MSLKPYLNRLLLIICLLIVINFLIISVFASTIDLPAPRLSSDVMLDEVLSFSPPSVIGDKNQLISLKEITQLLWAGQGISHLPFRTVPSAGGTYPLDIFLTPNKSIDGIRASTYHYSPIDHSIEEWIPSNVFDEIVTNVINNSIFQYTISDESILFTITAEYERTTTKYGNRGVQYVHLELGHLIQNLRLQARALQLQLELILDFDENELQSLLNVNYKPLLLVIVWKDNNSIQSAKVKEFEENDSLWLDSIYSAVSVEEAINERKSVRDYLDEPLTELEISNLLDLSYYKKDPFTGNLVFRSITDILPINLYLSVNYVNNLEPGVYKYNPHDRRFYQLINDSKRVELYEQSLKQVWVLNAPVVLVYTINQSKLSNSPQPVKLHNRLAMYEIGTIAQNIYLKSYSLGLGAVVVGAFSESGVRNAINASSSELPVYVMPIGKVTDIIFKKISYLSVDWWDSFFAWSSVLFFYFSCIIMSPPIKRKLKFGIRWIHGILGLFFVILSSLHLILNHGGWLLLTNPTIFRILEFIKSAWFYFSLDRNTPLNEIGLILSRITLWFVSIFGIASVFLFFSNVKTKVRRILKILHKYAGYSIAVGIILHTLINSIWMVNFGIWIYLLLISGSISYIILHNSIRINKLLKRVRSR